MKPGKPFVYGKLADGKARYFGLPGNPLSTAISARLFILPAIYQCFTDSPPALFFKAALTTPTKRKSNRAELQRGIAEKTAFGEWQVRIEKAQDSHRVSQFSRANVLVYLSADEGDKAEGELVNVLPLNGKFI